MMTCPTETDSNDVVKEKRGSVFVSTGPLTTRNRSHILSIIALWKDRHNKAVKQ